MFLPPTKPEFQEAAHIQGREVRNGPARGQGCVRRGQRSPLLANPEERKPLNSCLSVSLSEPVSLVIHKAQLLALSHSNVGFQCPHLAGKYAWDWSPGQKDREGLAVPGWGLLVVMSHWPRAQHLWPVPLLLCALHFPLMGLNQGSMSGPGLCWPRAPWLGHECPSLGSSAHRMCQGMFPQISASWGGQQQQVAGTGQGREQS